MVPKVILQAESLLPQLDSAFERGCWILHYGRDFLTDEFHRSVQRLTSEDAIACTSAVFDIMAAASLRYERNPGQRGFCMFLKAHPDVIGAETAWCGIVHEASHYLADQSPARDMTDERSAMKSFWSSMTPDDGHDRRWFRAASHLAFRAAMIGNVDVPSSVLFSGNADMPHRLLMPGLREELASRVNEPIESILASVEPSQFARAAGLVFDGTVSPAPVPVRSTTATTTGQSSCRATWNRSGCSPTGASAFPAPLRVASRRVTPR